MMNELFYLSLSFLINFFETHKFLAYLILFFGSFLEAIIGIGFIVRGEIFFLSGAILAGTGELNIFLVIIILIAGGIIGDTTNYFLGKTYGNTLFLNFFKKENKIFNYANFSNSKKFFKKHGTKAIFFGRFTGPISCTIPFFAGLSKIKYRKFLMYNIPGVVLGIMQFVIIGYLFGFSYTTFLPLAKKYLIYFIVLVIIIWISFNKSKIAKHIDEIIIKNIIKIFIRNKKRK